MTERAEVYSAIDSERDYQDSRWGVGHDRIHRRPEEWLVYLDVYLDKAKREITADSDDIAMPKVLNTIRKITALGVAAMEQLGAPRREGF